jgi:hypothetical protein
MAFILTLFFIPQKTYSQNEWFEKESAHFKIIYKTSHSHLAGYLLDCAERSYSVLRDIFEYEPTEKIILNTFDLYDYGFGEATSIPQNYIHIEIEPFEPGYENVSYNERFQWVINHELVHIFFNDQSNIWESAARTIFSKVAPEQIQPMTIFYSLITNYNRYSPVWHQEAIAIYLETWLSGGFGRVLGSFNEMYFRSLVLEKKEFPSINGLESVLPNNTFLFEMVYYTYAARFANFLALKYGNKTFLNWYKNNKSAFYSNFAVSFKENFGISLSDSWNEFISAEQKFQQENITRLSGAPVTKLTHLASEGFGWVSQPFYDSRTKDIYFSYHTKHQLASICRFNLESSKCEKLYSLPTPSQSQVASTAFDSTSGLYFFTTNNNQLYRDISVLDVKTNESKMILEDERIGNLSISGTDRVLWGVRHHGGEASIVYAPYPYREFEILRSFSIGEEIYNLSVSPSGKYLAVVLHKSSGAQQLLLVNLDNLNEVKVVYDIGSPENPSWSGDEKEMFFNAFTNGVSNIFSYSLTDEKTISISHTLKGLFKPVEISQGKIFAFEFSTDGFVPVVFDTDKISRMPAIKYLGQELFDRNPELRDYLVSISYEKKGDNLLKENYSGIENLKVQTFVPVISGFQSSVLLGFFTRISDPLLYHDFSLEAAYSVHDKIPSMPKFHIKTKYEYKKELSIGFDYNAPDFYDLFNTRKKGMIGEKYFIGYDYYYVYDNPLKVKQTTEIALYRGVIAFNDNLVPVSQPDFVVAQTKINSKNLRKSIGSSDFEKGDDFTVSFVLFGSDLKSPQISAQILGEWSKFFNWIAPHNTFSLYTAAGYRFENENHFQSKFFFGGFGNRELENTDVKQYRKMFRFPGIPIYDLFCDRFIKVGIENIFPPVRFENVEFCNNFLNYTDFSIYSQSLYINSSGNNLWVDLGAQINFVFKHWDNLESTFSAGIAKAFSKWDNRWDWFLSFKLLKN